MIAYLNVPNLDYSEHARKTAQYVGNTVEPIGRTLRIAEFLRIRTNVRDKLWAAPVVRLARVAADIDTNLSFSYAEKGWWDGPALPRKRKAVAGRMASWLVGTVVVRCTDP